MAKLRLETSQAHDSIERSPTMCAIFSEDYALQDYTTLLKRLLPFYSAIESIVFDRFPTQWATKFDRGRKATLLRDDLRALGVSIAEDRAVVPALATFEERAGALYVIEGATLGGKLICRQLLNHFGESVVPAVSFYSGYGKQTAAAWREFGELLGALFDNAPADEQARVVAGANATFSALERWLDPAARAVAKA